MGSLQSPATGMADEWRLARRKAHCDKHLTMSAPARPLNWWAWARLGILCETSNSHELLRNVRLHGRIVHVDGLVRLEVEQARPCFRTGRR